MKDVSCQTELRARVICSWCNATIRDGGLPTSHGICPRCREIHFPKTTSQESDRMNAHTPGPWQVSPLDARTVGPSRLLVSSGTAIHQLQAVAIVTLRTGETDANARLIAVAPELLDDARQNDNAFTWLAEQMNSITDNAKHWTVAQIEAFAQDLRIGIEHNQKRTRGVIAKADGAQ